MVISEYIKWLQNLVQEGKIKPTDRLLFTDRDGMWDEEPDYTRNGEMTIVLEGKVR